MQRGLKESKTKKNNLSLTLAKLSDNAVNRGQFIKECKTYDHEGTLLSFA